MKLAFVVPWYGPQATGGAETEARKAAEALYHRAGLDVEVLTTCSREFHGDWGADELPPGLDVVHGVPVRRFPVRSRNRQAFDAINARLMANVPVGAEDEQVFIREMINSDALCDFIRARAREYFFLFTPYMFGTTYHGTAVAPDRSALIPCLHDESYARLGIYREMFRRVRGVAFYSRAEMALAKRLFRLAPGAAALVPGGVDTDVEGDGGRFRAKHGLGDYLLYVGRKEAGKNVPLLLDYFARYRARARDDLQLVLLGKGDLRSAVVRMEGVLDLGFVPEQDKHDACAGAVALCQPSVNESFSIVMLEAWLAGAACLVHGDCAVTREHCLASDGGLFFRSYEEFEAAVVMLRERPAMRDALARQGRRYVLQHFTWDAAVSRYLAALRQWGLDPDVFRRGGAPAPLVRRRRAARAVHQLLAGFRPGDAISNHASALQRVFRSWGLGAEIFAADVADGASGAAPLDRLARHLEPDDVLVYHHSIHSDAAEMYAQTPARRVLVYHNITPAEYFEGVSGHHATLSRMGRNWLPTLVRASDRILADSSFNAAELRALGATCHVVPILLDLERYDRLGPEENVLTRYGDGRVNILFVGRIAPNKKQDDLIAAFRAYRRYHPGSRLLLVGSWGDDGGRYAEGLRDYVAQARLGGAVELTGPVSDRDLAAFYRVADVFVCLSEHEGFCVPIVEAMHFGVPVVAFAAGAVPETLGEAGILLDARDPGTVAAAVDRLMRDAEHRVRVVAAQRRRLQAFAPAVVEAMLRQHFADLLGTEPGVP